MERREKRRTNNIFTMLGVRRSACAWRYRGLTAGVILIAALLSLPADAQLTEPSLPGVTVLPELEEDATTSLPPMSDNITTVTPTTEQLNLTTEGDPSTTTLGVSPTTAPQPDVTSSGVSTKGTSRSTNPDVPVTDELATHPGMTTDNNTWLVPGDNDGDEDDFESALAMEFFVVIIVTVLVILAVMIIVAALAFVCCHRRTEKPTRFVKFKKRKQKHKYDKMDMEMGTLPRKHEPGGGSWIFSAPGAGVDGDHEDSGSMDLNLNTAPRTVTNEYYDPGANGAIEIAPSISDYHSSEGNHATLELEEEDDDLNVNPMFSSNGHSNRGSNKDSGIHGDGSDVGLLGEGETTIRSDTDLQSFADDSVEL